MPPVQKRTTTEQSVIHRVELALDDRPHCIDLTGGILHAAVRRGGAVDVWYRARPDSMQPMRRSFQIVGTGQPFPTWMDTHHQTAISPDGALVWHVMENHCTHQNVIDTTQYSQPPESAGICGDCRVDLDGDGKGEWRPRLGLS